MDAWRQPISVNPGQPFPRMSEDVLRTCIGGKDPTAEQVSVMADTAFALTREMWEERVHWIIVFGIPEHVRKDLWKTLVLDSWSQIVEDFFGPSFQVIDRRTM